MRINKFIASCGVASRRKAEELILSGKVKVNDKVVKDLATNIEPADSVTVNNKLIELTGNYEYYMLNKPKGYVCSASDDRNRKVVIDLINTNARIFPVGRLDYNSQGLLILTNDGELTYKLTHPKSNIGKTYHVKIEGEITNKELDTLRKGIVLEGVKLRSCEITKLETTNNQTKMEITIYEGRNREIRKMFESLNKTVTFLKRIKIGDLKLGSLDRGEYRKLTPKEVRYLKSL